MEKFKQIGITLCYYGGAILLFLFIGSLIYKDYKISKSDVKYSCQIVKDI